MIFPSGDRDTHIYKGCPWKDLGDILTSEQIYLLFILMDGGCRRCFQITITTGTEGWKDGPGMSMGASGLKTRQRKKQNTTAAEPSLSAPLK